MTMLNIFDSPLLRQYAVVIIVNFSAVATGVGLGWPSPVLVKLSDTNQTVLPEPITQNQGSWVVSIGLLTSTATNICIVQLIVDRLGRKYSLILITLPKLVACSMFIYASDVWMLLLGRALLGMGDVATFTILPMYSSEVASKDIRGSLGTMLQIMCSAGILIMLSMGPFVSYATLNIVLTTITVLTYVPLFILPDSPYFLYSRGRKEEALKVLTFLRGTESVANEEMKEYEIAAQKNNGSISKIEILKNPLFRKSLALVCILGFGAQFSGFNAVSAYLQTILESTQTSVRPEIASVVIGSIQMFASICTTLVTDRFGRKIILVSTAFGMAIGMVGLGTFFRLQDDGVLIGFMNYVPLISLILVVFCYSAGVGSLLWVLNAELFDDRSRGFGMSIGITVTSICMFLITKYFASVTSALGPANTYWIFSGNCVLYTLFIYFCIPETKGKTFSEIQDSLGKKRNSTNDNVKV
ncbi:facilitated trehalose transporter Tret1-like [Trichoplusia ni]|uniref:Facilitated trehalose transporter Tret1-like n=1 Tax=Trichoplusia ni TaxID=7111 RepID=A0A7E5WFJ7_TRINI|nr:facilitated trehalose transporter Tret1-like [Trichoplusia ni]